MLCRIEGSVPAPTGRGLPEGLGLPDGLEVAAGLGLLDGLGFDEPVPADPLTGVDGTPEPRTYGCGAAIPDAPPKGVTTVSIGVVYCALYADPTFP